MASFMHKLEHLSVAINFTPTPPPPPLLNHVKHEHDHELSTLTRRWLANQRHFSVKFQWRQTNISFLFIDIHFQTYCNLLFFKMLTNVKTENMTVIVNWESV